MSKNPPKPNTSPDHVKETAEAFTRPSSARPEHGPSHIEARERLQAALGDLDRCTSEPEWTGAACRLREAVRTLLATPTQGKDISSSRELSPATGSALDDAEDDLRALVHTLFDALRRSRVALNALRPSDGCRPLMARINDALLCGIHFGCELGEAFEIPGLPLSSAEQVAGKVPGMQNNTSDTTQEGVGREEIARIREIAAETRKTATEAERLSDGWGACFTAEDRQQMRNDAELLDRAAASLLPAPKPREGIAPGLPSPAWRVMTYEEFSTLNIQGVFLVYRRHGEVQVWLEDQILAALKDNGHD